MSVFRPFGASATVSAASTTGRTSPISYDATRFNPKPSADYLCPICHCVLYQPRMCPCQHIFCRACIETWLLRSSTCPTCRHPSMLRQMLPAPPLVQSVLNSLTMDCDNNLKGCTTLVPMEQFQSHIKICEYRPAECPHADCKFETVVKDLQEHKESCQYRTKKCDKTCGVELAFYMLENHDCVETLKGKVQDLTSQVHDFQRGLGWIRRKINGLHTREHHQAVVRRTYGEILDYINQRRSLPEQEADPATHSSTSTLSRVFGPRYADEGDGPTAHVVRDFPVRGVVRDFQTVHHHRRFSDEEDDDDHLYFQDIVEPLHRHQERSLLPLLQEVRQTPGPQHLSPPRLQSTPLADSPQSPLHNNMVDLIDAAQIVATIDAADDNANNEPRLLSVSHPILFHPLPAPSRMPDASGGNASNTPDYDNYQAYPDRDARRNNHLFSPIFEPPLSPVHFDRRSIERLRSPSQNESTNYSDSDSDSVQQSEYSYMSSSRTRSDRSPGYESRSYSDRSRSASPHNRDHASGAGDHESGSDYVNSPDPDPTSTDSYMPQTSLYTYNPRSPESSSHDRRQSRRHRHSYSPDDDVAHDENWDGNESTEERSQGSVDEWQEEGEDGSARDEHEEDTGDRAYFSNDDHSHFRSYSNSPSWTPSSYSRENTGQEGYDDSPQQEDAHNSGDSDSNTLHNNSSQESWRSARSHGHHYSESDDEENHDDDRLSSRDEDYLSRAEDASVQGEAAESSDHHPGGNSASEGQSPLHSSAEQHDEAAESSDGEIDSHSSQHSHRSWKLRERKDNDASGQGASRNSECEDENAQAHPTGEEAEQDHEPSREQWEKDSQTTSLDYEDSPGSSKGTVKLHSRSSSDDDQALGACDPGGRCDPEQVFSGDNEQHTPGEDEHATGEDEHATGDDHPGGEDNHATGADDHASEDETHGRRKNKKKKKSKSKCKGKGKAKKRRQTTSDSDVNGCGNNSDVGYKRKHKRARQLDTEPEEDGEAAQHQGEHDGNDGTSALDQPSTSGLQQSHKHSNRKVSKSPKGKEKTHSHKRKRSQPPPDPTETQTSQSKKIKSSSKHSSRHSHGETVGAQGETGAEAAGGQEGSGMHTHSHIGHHSHSVQGHGGASSLAESTVTSVETTAATFHMSGRAATSSSVCAESTGAVWSHHRRHHRGNHHSERRERNSDRTMAMDAQALERRTTMLGRLLMEERLPTHTRNPHEDTNFDDHHVERNRAGRSWATGENDLAMSQEQRRSSQAAHEPPCEYRSTGNSVFYRAPGRGRGIMRIDGSRAPPAPESRPPHEYHGRADGNHGNPLRQEHFHRRVMRVDGSMAPRSQRHSDGSDLSRARVDGSSLGEDEGRAYRRAVEASRRVMTIEDVPVRPTALELLRRFTENNDDETDSTWSPHSSQTESEF